MKLMFILAHPDDAEIWNGGTIFKNIDEKNEIEILYLFAEKNRINEAKKITYENNLNVKIIKPAKERIKQEIICFKPEVIVTHWENDCHFQHKRCFELLYSLLPDLMVFHKLKFSLYACDTYNSIGADASRFEPNYFVDISKFFDKKVNAIENHKSQPTEYFIKMINEQNTYWGKINGTKYSEAFRKLPVLGQVCDYEL